jgi:hemolysin activation/secretion protein
MKTTIYRWTGRPWTKALGLAGMVLLLAARVHAQSFDQIAPKQPEQGGQGKLINSTGAPVFSGHGDSEVLVAHLKGIVLLSDPKQVRPQGVSSSSAIVPGPISMAKRPDFAAAVQPYLGQPVTMKSLAELTRSIVAFYRAHDRPVVNVYVPQQSITKGYVQVVVVESRVEKVDAIGAHWFSNNYLRAQVSLRPGEPLSANQMRGDLNWINRNPFLQSDMLLAPGDAPGTTDVLLRTQDRFPLRVYAGYDNTGNQYTGENRYYTGFNYGNLFGVGQQLSYQFTSGADLNNFYAHAGTYIVPLPWRHQLTIFGSYSATDAEVQNGLNSGGVNWQVSGRYEIPLPGTAHFTESVTAGFDFKRSNNSLAFNILPAADTSSNTDIDQFVASYQASGSDDYGSTTGSITGFFSPGGMTNYNTTADYQAQRLDARANYVYGQIALDRVTRLPLDFSWTVRGEVQVSDANLLPSEQFGLGGYDTVRGYEEREVNGDNGFLISTEVATPPVSLAHVFGCTQVNDQLQFLGFVDYGGTTLHQVTPADTNPSSDLLGVGPGVRYVINPYVSVRFDYGFQLINPGVNNGEHSRADFGVLVSY